MARIGIFTRNSDGTFTGTISTLTLNVSAVFRPMQSDNDKAPDLRLFVADVEVGAAWKRTSKDKHEYFSAKVDDPAFAAPIHANLVPQGDKYALMWSR